MKTFRVLTLGCKVNQYESEQLRTLLEAAGLQHLDADHADLHIVNTCCVTAEAARKSRQMLRRAKSRNPNAKLVAAGCYATQSPALLERRLAADLVLTHGEHAAPQRLRQWLDRPATTRWPHRADDPDSPDTSRVNSTAPPDRPPSPTNPSAAPRGAVAEHIASRLAVKPNLPPAGPALTCFKGHQRAFLKVQDGCDAFCSYCIIPYLRRQTTSRPLDAVVSEARQLVAAGHKEIVLTGVFLGAYGRATALRRRWPPSTERAPLARLVEAVAAVPGLARLRLSSLEPGDVDDDLLAILKAHRPVTVPHLHLPLQAGSPDVLRRMNRQYSADDFRAMIDRVRADLPEPAITTDIVVGFPGETEHDFRQTLDLARASAFSKMHIFPYSARNGTAAARYPGRVPKPVVHERTARLKSLERDLSLAFRAQFVGRSERVIVESPRPSQPGRQVGHADRYFHVEFQADRDLTGRLVEVRILRAEPDTTVARLQRVLI